MNATELTTPSRPGARARTQSSPGPADALELLAQGLAARAAKDFGTALELLRSAWERTPENSNLEVELAFTLLSMSRLDEAETHYQRVLRRVPAQSSALSGLAHVARRRGDLLAALTYFEAAVATEPQSTTLQLLLAEAERGVRRLEAARIRYQAVLAMSPGEVAARLGLAHIALQQNDPSSAVAQAEEAALEHPGVPDVQAEAAKLLMSAGRWGRAEQMLLQTLQRAPGHVTSLMVMHQLARQRGDSALSLAYLQRARDADPHNPNIAAQLGQALSAAGRTEEARAAYRLALQRAPQHLIALRGLAQLSRELEEFDTSLDYLRSAAQAHSQDPQIKLDLAAVLLELQRTDEADALIESVFQNAHATGNTAVQMKCFQHYCTSLQLDKAATCLATLTTAATSPERPAATTSPKDSPWPPGAAAAVASFYASTAQWDKVIDLFCQRHNTAPWKGSPEQRQILFEALARAARNTGNYTQILDLVEKTSDLTSDEPALTLTDQLREEHYLRHAAQSTIAPHEIPFNSALRARRTSIIRRTLFADRGAESERTVYFCTDSTYLLGSITSLLSLLRHNLTSVWRYDVKVYASPDALPLAQAALAELSRVFSVAIDVRSSATLIEKDLVFRTGWGVFTPGHALSEAAYYRIYAALQLHTQGGRGRALYLDSDTCIGPGLDRLLEHDLKSRPLAARTEIGTLPSIRRAARKLGVQAATYFNSGVLLFDLSHPKLVPALQESIQFALTRKHLLTFLDQCALNAAFSGQVTELPAEYNSFVRQDTDRQGTIPVVTHFLERPKPWDPMYGSPNCLPWVEEFAALGQVLPSDLVRRLYLAQFPPGAPAPLGTAASVSDIQSTE